jgi:hypothetical protein
LKAGSILSVRIDRSGNLVDFPDLEARVDIQDSI